MCTFIFSATGDLIIKTCLSAGVAFFATKYGPLPDRDTSACVCGALRERVLLLTCWHVRGEASTLAGIQDFLSFLFFVVVFFMLLLHVFVSGRRGRWKWQMTPPRGRRWKNTCFTKIIYKTKFFYVFFGLSTWRDRMRLAWWEALKNETFRVSMKVMGPC